MFGSADNMVQSVVQSPKFYITAQSQPRLQFWPCHAQFYSSNIKTNLLKFITDLSTADMWEHRLELLI